MRCRGLSLARIANNTITRNPGSNWVIPTDNEWYKAAYHKNDGVTDHYYLYPTSSDAAVLSNE